MAYITLNTNTTTSPTALALPDNARIVIIDTDTNTEAADLVISGAESLIIADDDVQITTTATATAATAGGGAEDTDTGNTETGEAPNTLTVSHNTGTAVPRYSFCLIYNKATGIYTDSTTGTEVATDTVIDIIHRAYENETTTAMTFDIPGHGVTTFTGDLFENYNGHAGITLVGANGGAYILNSASELTDDMTVLNEARFIFSGNPDVIFDNLDIDVIDGDIDADAEDAGTEDCVDEDTADIQRTQTEKTFYPDIPAFDADAKLYTKISSRTHNLKSYAVRRIVEYAATHDLSARLWVMLTEDAAKPYVGYLQPMTNDPDNTKFLFVDEKLKLGEVPIDLSKTDHDFVLEVYSDANMHCRIFVDTDHAGYGEVSIVEMLTHINTALDM